MIIMAFSRRALMEKAVAAAEGVLQHAAPGHRQGKACRDQPWKHRSSSVAPLDGAKIAKGSMD